ncbi:glycoside hydrolase [Frankia sp. CcI49]|uniref:glycoside hydrolase family 2 n=1 Tax=Frankia sp. CcI49 TaxID=1745382 RepID=UPI000976E191|nr:glycoside hydrolase family 2 [Frankia sp. CcI49]ONH52057.1 glycoside hydrolase [Frankia sp. CcI49]
MIRTSFNDDWSYRRKPDTFQALLGRATDGWEPVRLPHDAMVCRERSGSDPESAHRGYFPADGYEYRKSFPVPAEHRERRVTLEFEGVYRQARVYVNDDLAGQCASGYSTFRVPVDHLLRYGAENEVRVEARSQDDTRWYSGGGLYRGVSLIVGGLLHVALDGVRVTTPVIDGELAVVAVATDVQNQSAVTRTVEVRTEIADAGGEIVARDVAPVTVFPGDTATLRQRLTVTEPRRWGVDHPYLHTCRTTVTAEGERLDEETTRFGIRSLTVDARRGLRINGEPVKLRGACIHHDNGVLGAATIDRAEHRRVEILKQAGFNAIRSAHNPVSAALLDACDQLGMLVMDELSDVWTRSKTADDHAGDFAASWESDLRAMVAKDQNHPCVVFYSIGNEIPEIGGPVGAVFSRRLAERVRELDGTRLITNGVNGMFAGGPELLGSLTGGGARPAETDAGATGASGAEPSRAAGAETSGAAGAAGAEAAGVAGAEASGAENLDVNAAMTRFRQFMPMLMTSELVTSRTAEAMAYLDIAGYNYLDSRYELDRTLFPNRVIVGTETYPTDIDRNWRLVQDNSHVIGDFTWTGWDYLGEPGIGRVEYQSDPAPTAGGMPGHQGAYPWLAAWCGDIDITGHRRPASYYREIVFGLRAEPYIAVHRPDRHGDQVRLATWWSWSDSISSWSWAGHEGRPVRIDVYSAADEVELLIDGRSVGREPAGEKNRFTAAFETVYQPGELTAVAYIEGRETGRTSLRSATGDVRLDVTADRSRITADDRDLAFVTVTLVDAAGNLHNTADRPVAVELTGPGVLQGFGSADPRPEENFFDRTRTTFDGRALAVIRPTGPGVITVTVTADGCAPAVVRVEAAPAHQAEAAPADADQAEAAR